MLELSHASGDPLDRPVDILLIACGDGEWEAGDPAAGANGRLDGLLQRSAAEERFRGKPGQSLLAHTHGALPARRVALVGLGPLEGDAARALRTSAANAVRIAGAVGASTAAFAWPRFAGAAALEAAAEGAWLGAYRFDRYLTDERSRAPALASLALFPPAPVDEAAAAAALGRARTATRAVARARDLVNEPAGVLTPTRIAALASEWAAAAGISVEVLDRAACAALGMGLYLAVAQGSHEEPRFVHLAWKPTGARRRLVLVGKGVTFD
ncbi:MAG TPA: M17 family peptidase N-terminal domain-containing protein, partial [Polyangia bacterium]